ncbi:MAG: radical SAM protein [Anaerolineae bacterium]|nr:radical SAM protein [Anaerolineae bacterium]
MENTIQSTKRAFLITNGCPENRIDAAGMQALLVSNGWAITPDATQADMIFFNACGLTDDEERDSLEIIRDLKRRKQEDARLIVCGCFPRIHPAALEKLYDDITFGSDDIESFSEIIQADPSGSYPCAHVLLPKTSTRFGVRKILSKFRKLSSPYFLWCRCWMSRRYQQYWEQVNLVHTHSYYVKVSTGCVNQCAYCAVKLSRGNIRSKPIQNILTEVCDGLKEGFSNIALIGTDLGSYGIDRGVTLVELLREIVALPGDFRVKLRNVHPGLLIRKSHELLPIFETGKIDHMTSAIQAGNDRILKLMNRNYAVEPYLATLDMLKKACPSLRIRSQMIAGFPSETEEEFQDSVRTIEKGPFDFVEVYPFSARINTPAATLANKLPSGVVMYRNYRLTKAVLEKLESKN